LYSHGTRNINPDAPFQVFFPTIKQKCSEPDKVHLECGDVKTTTEEVLKDVDISKLHGFVQLSKEEREKYSTIS
jgi:hypothetical protein